jgi:K+-transporting ATPase ATPase C chain
MTPQEVNELIDRHTQDASLGFLGEKGVNVLELNLALDARSPSQGTAPVEPVGRR